MKARILTKAGIRKIEVLRRRFRNPPRIILLSQIFFLPVLPA